MDYAWMIILYSMALVLIITVPPLWIIKKFVTWFGRSVKDVRKF